MQPVRISGTVNVTLKVTVDHPVPVPGAISVGIGPLPTPVGVSGHEPHVGAGVPQAGLWMQLLQARRPQASRSQVEITPAARASGEALAAAGIAQERIAAIVSPIMDAEAPKVSKLDLEVAAARISRAARATTGQECDVELNMPRKLADAYEKFKKLSKAVRDTENTSIVGGSAETGAMIGGCLHPLMLLGGYLVLHESLGGGRSTVAAVGGAIIAGLGFLLGGFLTVSIGALVGAIVGAVKKAVYNHDKKHVEAVEAKARELVDEEAARSAVV